MRRFAACLVLICAISAAIPAADPEGALYVNLPGGDDSTGFTVRLYNANNQNRTTSLTCRTSACRVRAPGGVYYMTIERKGFWPYRTSPFTLSPRQIIPFQPAMAQKHATIAVSDVLTYVSVIFVILGLFREQLIRAFIKYPKLALVVSTEPPCCHLSPLSWLQMKAENRSTAGTIPSSEAFEFAEIGPDGQADTNDQFVVRFCRVFVKNIGTSEVTDVEAFVSSMWDINGEQVQEVRRFLPLNLRWANSWNFYRPQVNLESDAPLHKSRISSGIGRFCDLGFIVEPRAAGRYFSEAGLIDSPRELGAAPAFQFAFGAMRTDEGHWSDKHRLLELAIDGENMETELFYVELEVRGPWVPNKGPQVLTLRCADPRLIKAAGRQRWRFHFHEITESLRTCRDFLLHRRQKRQPSECS